MTSALRLAAMRAILMFHNCQGQRHKTVSIDRNFWSERRAEADSNRGPSAYKPNALPLGQTGSRGHAINKQADKHNTQWMEMGMRGEWDGGEMEECLGMNGRQLFVRVDYNLDEWEYGSLVQCFIIIIVSCTAQRVIAAVD